MESLNDSKENLVRDDVVTVKDALLAFTAINQNTVLLDYGNVLIQRNYQNITKVRLISGGIAGRDLIHALFVGKGMLTAAVLGDQVAPSSRLILHTIHELSQSENSGLLVITEGGPDLFNFGLAVERANTDCRMRVRLLPIKDDSSLTRGRYSCGFILLVKVLGAMAESGAVFEDIWQRYKDIADLITTVPLNYLDEETDEGIKRQTLCLDEAFENNVSFVIDDKSQWKLNLHPSHPTVVLINTSKTLQRISELGLVKLVIDRMRQLGVCIVRMYVGHFVAAPPRTAFLTAMKLHDMDVVGLLDAPCEAPGWHQVFQHQPEIITKNQISGVLVNKGKQPILLEGPKLGEAQTEILITSIRFACEALISCERQINIIDGELGDGNIGTRLKYLAEQIIKRIENKKLAFHCPYAFLKKLGILSESTMGGTLGSIYGILFENAAYFFRDLPENEMVTGFTWAKAFSRATNALKQYTNDEKESRSMFNPIKACETVVNEQIGPDKDLIECWGLGVTLAEEAALSTRVSHCKYADPGAHAVGIWMRAVFEGVKLMSMIK